MPRQNPRPIAPTHLRIRVVLDRIEQEARTGGRPPVLDRLLACLMLDSRLQFTTQEQLMREHGYPATQEHQKEHDRFLRAAGRLEKELKQGNIPWTPGIAQYFKDWVRKHTATMDGRLREFLDARARARPRTELAIRDA
jgi:hemerythrin